MTREKKILQLLLSEVVDRPHQKTASRKRALCHVAPQHDPRAEPFELYRCYGHDDELLYVGKTARSFGVRLSEHQMREAEWVVEIANIKIERFATHGELVMAEQKAIRTEMPKYNTIHAVPLAA